MKLTWESGSGSLINLFVVVMLLVFVFSVGMSAVESQEKKAAPPKAEAKAAEAEAAPTLTDAERLQLRDAQWPIANALARVNAAQKEVQAAAEELQRAQLAFNQAAGKILDEKKLRGKYTIDADTLRLNPVPKPKE